MAAALVTRSTCVAVRGSFSARRAAWFTQMPVAISPHNSRGMRLALGAPHVRPAWPNSSRRYQDCPTMTRILIVDDETNYRVLLRACLERAGHDVLDLANASEVLELACARKPDAILLDFDLPDGLGTDVCRSLKANAATRSIPVIMVTGRTGEQDRVECFEAGADDLVGKPFSLRELLLRIRSLVQRKGTEPHEFANLERSNA
jgi:CheY-like chemotaxis protein